MRLESLDERAERVSRRDDDVPVAYPRWEYRSMHFQSRVVLTSERVTNDLNALGREGWEVVSYTPQSVRSAHVLLRRPLP